MRAWLPRVPLAVLVALSTVGGATTSVRASRVAPADRAFDPDALMQPTFRAPAAAPAPPASALERTLRDEAAELRTLQLEADAARGRFERQSARLRRASAERLRARGVAVDWRAYDLASLHAWERRLAGAASRVALALDDDALLPPGSVPAAGVRRHRMKDADGVLAPGSVAAHATPAAWRRDPDALLPLGYAARPAPARRGFTPVDADAPLGY